MTQCKAIDIALFENRNSMPCLPYLVMDTVTLVMRKTKSTQLILLEEIRTMASARLTARGICNGAAIRGTLEHGTFVVVRILFGLGWLMAGITKITEKSWFSEPGVFLRDYLVQAMANTNVPGFYH